MYFSQSCLVDSRIGNFIGRENQNFGRSIVVRHSGYVLNLISDPAAGTCKEYRKQGVKDGNMKN